MRAGRGVVKRDIEDKKKKKTEFKKETWQGERSGFQPDDELSFMGSWP